MSYVTWWDWLLCPSQLLKERGLDPEHRVRYTGHRRPLSSRWAQTIGMWCRAEASDIIRLVEQGHTATETRASYDQFKFRHKLWTRPRFISVHLDDSLSKSDRDLVFLETGPVMVATYAHSRVAAHLSRSPMSPGIAAELSAKMRIDPATGSGIKDPLGLLPIEILLYYYAIEYIFEQTSITYDQWVMGEKGPNWLTRAAYWKRFDSDNSVVLPDEALERYPLQHG